jgi:hypothetical protein
MDLYLGVVIGTIYEKYMVDAVKAEKFTKQQIMSPSPFIAYNIFNMIPTLKEKIKEQVGL